MESFFKMYMEPSAEIKKACANIRQMYNGYIEVGFSEDQALELIKTMMSAYQK